MIDKIMKIVAENLNEYCDWENFEDIAKDICKIYLDRVYEFNSYGKAINYLMENDPSLIEARDLLLKTTDDYLQAINNFDSVTLANCLFAKNIEEDVKKAIFDLKTEILIKLKQNE